MDKISVIMPCYNVEKWIDRSLASIEQQSIGMDAIEMILVDDCSTDGTLLKLLDWEKKYPDNVCVIKSEENGRQGQARNIGLQYATGEWIAFVDSDDWVEKDYLEKMYKIAISNDYQVVSCKSIRDASTELTYLRQDLEKQSEKSRSTRKADREYLINDDERRRAAIINPPLDYVSWGKLIQKDFLLQNDIFFPANLTYEDIYWGSLLNIYFERAYVLDERLYHYFVNDGSTVLLTNSNHHLDCLTVNTLLWDEWERRGLFELYRPELELEHVYSAYLLGMKSLILRYEVPDYNIYLLLRTLILQRIPEFSANIYICNNRLSEFHMLLMGALKNQLNRPQFLELAENIKKIGI